MMHLPLTFEEIIAIARKIRALPAEDREAALAKEQLSNVQAYRVGYWVAMFCVAAATKEDRNENPDSR